jgi:hypothetical protein
MKTMNDIKLNEIRCNMLLEEIAVNFFATITPFDYRRIEFIGIDPTLTIKYKKIKIKDLGIKNILTENQIKNESRAD